MTSCYLVDFLSITNILANNSSLLHDGLLSCRFLPYLFLTAFLLFHSPLYFTGQNHTKLHQLLPSSLPSSNFYTKQVNCHTHAQSLLTTPYKISPLHLYNLSPTKKIPVPYIYSRQIIRARADSGLFYYAFRSSGQ